MIYFMIYSKYECEPNKSFVLERIKRIYVKVTKLKTQRKAKKEEKDKCSSCLGQDYECEK